MTSVCFIRNSSTPIPRVLRMVVVAEEIGMSTCFLGAKRNRHDNSEDVWSGVLVSRVGCYWPLLNGKRPIRLLVGLVCFNFSVLVELFKRRPDIVHASDYESALPALIYKFICKKVFIYNIHDNLHERYPLHKYLVATLRFFETSIIRFSDVCVVPEEFRRASFPISVQNKIKVIKNTPNVSEVGVLSKPVRNKIRIFYAGWIDEGRGIRELLSISQEEGIEVVIAGDGDASLVSEIELNPSCEFLGYLSHEDILKQTKASDFIYAVYDPVRVINRFAASNKIAEALAFGIPVIVNKEMKVSEILEANDCCISVDYDDVKNVSCEIKETFNNSERYASLSRNCQKLYLSNYDWKIVKNKIAEIFSLYK